jgi:predicted Zn-dependent peptidase
MSTLSFSIPDRIKEEFNKYYANENKSAVLTGFLEEAIEDKKKQEQRSKAIEAILEFRKSSPYLSDEEIRNLRQEMRD